MLCQSMAVVARLSLTEQTHWTDAECSVWLSANAKNDEQGLSRAKAGPRQGLGKV